MITWGVKIAKSKPLVNSTEKPKTKTRMISRISATPSTTALTWMPEIASRKTMTKSTTPVQNQSSVTAPPVSSGTTTMPAKKPMVPSAPATKAL